MRSTLHCATRRVECENHCAVSLAKLTIISYCRFRWVHCQLDTLKRCVTAVGIREALSNLPSDLNATYERILHQINQDEEGKVARRALDWLLFALVPLQLCQIVEILSISLGEGVLDHDSGPVHGPALLDALGSLVMYDEITDIVILSHFSVKASRMCLSVTLCG